MGPAGASSTGVPPRRKLSSLNPKLRCAKPPFRHGFSTEELDSWPKN